MSIKRIFWNLIPAENKHIFSLCKHYTNQYNSENNGNIQTNGELQLIRNVLPQCKVVFDVGANIGDWTALALKINPSLNIHCFEPSTATFQRLKACNFGENVTLNNFGLSSAYENLPLHVYEDGSGLNSLYVRHGLEEGLGLASQSKVEFIRVQTLDGYCQQANIPYIDFLKVDVEGHELEVFKGALSMLSQGKIKRIQFEYGGCNIDAGVLLKDLFEFFEPYHYAFYKIYPNNIRHIPRYDQRNENYQYQNWLIIHNE